MTHRALLVLMSAIGMALSSLSGCASDGRTLAPPSPDQTTTIRPPASTSAPDAQASASGLALSSPDFAPGASAPVDATCDGRNVFPALGWENVPANAAEIVITLTDVTDPTTPTLIWLLAGINPVETGLTSGSVPPAAYETVNAYNSSDYGNPCFDVLGQGRRDLQFRIFVLLQPSGLAPNTPAAEAAELLDANAIDTASLLMRYP